MLKLNNYYDHFNRWRIAKLFVAHFIKMRNAFFKEIKFTLKLQNFLNIYLPQSFCLLSDRTLELGGDEINIKSIYYWKLLDKNIALKCFWQILYKTVWLTQLTDVWFEWRTQTAILIQVTLGLKWVQICSSLGQRNVFSKT